MRDDLESCLRSLQYYAIKLLRVLLVVVPSEDRRFDESVIHPRDNKSEEQRSQGTLPDRSRDGAIGYNPFLVDPDVSCQRSESNHTDERVADLKQLSGRNRDAELIANIGYRVDDDKQGERGDGILEAK